MRTMRNSLKENRVCEIIKETHNVIKCNCIIEQLMCEPSV